MPIENLHDHFQGKDVLITGGIGVVGSHHSKSHLVQGRDYLFNLPDKPVTWIPLTL